MRPRVVPPPHARIDWTHPLARGLVCAFQAGACFASAYGGSGIAIVNGGQRRSGTLTGVRSADTYEGNGTNGGGSLGTFKFGTELTAVACCVWDTQGGGSYSRVVENGMFSTATALSTQLDITRIGTTTSATRSMTGIPANTPNTIGIFIPNSLTNTDIQGWLNGAPKSLTGGSSGSGSPSGNNALGNIWLCDNNSGSRVFDGRVRFVYFWNRRLSDAEHALVHRDPWCFWIWEEFDLGLGGPYTIESTFQSFSNVTRSGAIASWQNTSNAQSLDNNNANTHFPGPGPLGVFTSDYLVAADLTKTLGTEAVIAGIEIDVERKRDGTYDEKDSQVKLRRAGTLESTDKADTSTVWPTSDGVKTYGGTADKWGANWTPADLNDSGFGVAVSLTGDAGGMGGGGEGA